MKHVVTLEAPYASGNRLPWFKTVLSVVPDNGQSARHHCFKGEFLDSNREYQLETGTLIVALYPTGGFKSPSNLAKLLRVTAEGEVECLTEGAVYDWQKDFHSFHGIVKRELANIRGLKAATASLCPALDVMTEKFTAFHQFRDLLEAEGGYVPSLVTSADSARAMFADIYDFCQDLRGDSRRVFRS